MGCLLSQTKYITSILKWTHLENCKHTSSMCSPSSLSHTFETIDLLIYQSTINALQYLMIT